MYKGNVCVQVKASLNEAITISELLQDECLTQSVKEKPQYFVAHVEIRKQNI